MTSHPAYNAATSSLLARSTQTGHLQHTHDEEATAEADEPPDPRLCIGITETKFQRTAVRKTTEHSESLLTRALTHSEEDTPRWNFRPNWRNSSVSLASTADLTSDTGLTSPARTNTPSPPPPVIAFSTTTDVQAPKANVGFSSTTGQNMPSVREAHNGPNNFTSADLPKKRCISFACGPKPEAEKTAPQATPADLPKKRCISFACGPKPEAEKPAQPAEPVKAKPAAEKPARRPCIKFACTAKPAQQEAALRSEDKRSAVPKPIESPRRLKPGSPSTLRKYRSPSTGRGRTPRSLTPRPSSHGFRAAPCKKYLTANHDDLTSECSRFHEFASDEPQEEDWIRRTRPSSRGRLTINDTLRKENEIRRLGKEAEDEALEEEGEEEGEQEESDVDEDETDPRDEMGEDEDAEDEDEQSGYDSDDATSDGYNTDNEVGFADSDEDEDDGFQLWTLGQGTAVRLSSNTPVQRRPSLHGNRSDSSSSGEGDNMPSIIREKSKRIRIRRETPELPDSTDFVCGTLDEDRAIEDAYISCIAAKRREKLHLIPQDIDPSFPTSEPEDEEIEPHKHAHDSDEHCWIHGELEDLHHTRDHTRDHDGERRRKAAGHTSPKRFRSPPPKRHHSPPPKSRGRSPKRLFDRHSPRRLVSPAPQDGPMRSPPGSLVHGERRGPHEFSTLAFRPGLTHTKSLPRAPAFFPQHLKGHRRGGKAALNGGHVRGAIDIVKGLEQKRQRRREKFKEKYVKMHNEKARKGQLSQRPEPGKGAERMREIGLLSAGKIGPDRFVLSV
ncbi:hypothetical protein GGR56DRAFT_289813 [Xylariaceae sp. FL0804]|nr:hypothetical protein GGR56DRAFT_289813 [Xylariaceae sp. FL0804]